MIPCNVSTGMKYILLFSRIYISNSRTLSCSYLYSDASYKTMWSSLEIYEYDKNVLQLQHTKQVHWKRVTTWKIGGEEHLEWGTVVSMTLWWKTLRIYKAKMQLERTRRVATSDSWIICDEGECQTAAKVGKSVELLGRISRKDKQGQVPINVAN